MTKINEKIDPPACLADAGRSLWGAVTGPRDLDQAQRDILLLACKQADRAAEARQILTSDKVVSVDRFGQEKIHPAVVIERAASLACAKLVLAACGEVPAGEAADAEEFE